MNKRNLIIILVSISILMLISPLLIEWLYEIGKVCPLIITPYVEADMLDYVASVIGAMTGVVALLISIRTEQVRLSITHAITVNECNEDCILFRIINNGVYECDIVAVCIANKSRNHTAHIISTAPFSVKAKSTAEFIVPTKKVMRVINSFQRSDLKFDYLVKLSTGKQVVLKAENLVQILKAQKVATYSHNGARKPISVRVRKVHNVHKT